MYLLLAALNASLGALTLIAPRTGVILFSVSLIAVPSSPVFDEWTYRGGLHVYDFYFLVLICTYLVYLFRGVPRALLRDSLLLMLVFAIGSLGTLLHAREIDKYVLRDLRPFLLVMEGMVLLTLLRRQNVRVTDRDVLWIGLGAGLSPFISFGLTRLGLYDVTDLFYQANSYRHAAIGTFIAAVALIWLAGNAKRAFSSAPMLTLAMAIVAGGAVVLAGMRMLVFATVVGCAFAGRLKPLQIVLTAVLTALLIGGFAFVSIEADVERVTEAVTIADLAAQLERRFGPALEKIRVMEWWQWVSGTGLGTTFIIPWFEYRGLDTRHNAVDSMYLTLAIKFGVLSLLYVWLLARSLGIGLLSASMRRGLLVFVGLAGVTMALPYQKYTIGITLLCAYLARVEGQRIIPRMPSRRLRASDLNSGCHPAQAAVAATR